MMQQAREVAKRGVTVGPWWIVLLSAIGLANLAALVAHGGWEPSDPLWDVPAVVGQLATAAVLFLGPWVYMTVTRLDGEATVRRLLRRGTAAMAVLTTIGLGFAVGAAAGASGADDPAAGARMAGEIGSLTVALAFLLALGGLVLAPWILVLTRQVTRERAARVRAEARTDVAAHLHDSVLQALTLIQKQLDEPATVASLARQTERDLRAWLYGSTTGDHGDLAEALRAVAAEVEDRFGITVEVVLVGTCQLGEGGHAVVGAAREALTNAAKHSGVQQVSVFGEAADAEILVVVRDRGRGFDQTAVTGPDHHGIRGSIMGRVRRHGGTATIRTSIDQGSEVELRMPVRTTA